MLFLYNICFFSSRRRQTRCALVNGVQTCALPICFSSAKPVSFKVLDLFDPWREHRGVDRARPLRRSLDYRKPSQRSARIVADAARLASTRRHPFDCGQRSEEHTSELQSLMRISYAVFCLKKKKLR